MKDGKTLANGSQSSESSREARYDSVNGFLSDKKSSESKSEGENGHGNSVEDYEYFYQADSANGYKIDKHVKSYQKKETTKGTQQCVIAYEASPRTNFLFARNPNKQCTCQTRILR